MFQKILRFKTSGRGPKQNFVFVGILLLVVLLALPVYTTYASPMPSYVRIGLVSRFSGRASVAISNGAILVGHNYFESVDGFIVRPYGGHQVALYTGGHRLFIFDPATRIVCARGGFIWLEDGAHFRGAVEFARLGTGVTAVNTLSLEEYLFSVVPSEMPASWHPEALKAQAVAARTYALHMISQGSSHIGFDLCDMVCCQVYRGVEWEQESTTYAVLATAGLAMYFGGELIEAVYSASSGGVTENSENVWIEARPYLRSVPDLFEYEPVVWTRSFTLPELSHLLTQNGRGAVGAATGMSIGAFHPSGRVESLVIHGTNGQAVLTKEEIRTFFGPSAQGSLPSRNFNLGVHHVGVPHQPVFVSVFDGWEFFEVPAQGLYVITAQGMTIYNTEPIAPQPGHGLTMHGRGFGHGVGMSQRGAQGMAIRGYGFRDILAHFYTGIVVE